MEDKIMKVIVINKNYRFRVKLLMLFRKKLGYCKRSNKYIIR